MTINILQAPVAYQAKPTKIRSIVNHVITLLTKEKKPELHIDQWPHSHQAYLREFQHPDELRARMMSNLPPL